MSDTEYLAKTFVTAAGALGTALVDHLKTNNPEFAAKVGIALANGERMQLSAEFAPDGAPLVKLATIDDYGTLKRVMHLNPAREVLQ